MSLRPTLVVFAVLIASLSLGTLGLVLYLGSDAFVDSMPAPVVGPHVSAETSASAFDRNDFVGAMRATDKLLAINPANISALLAKANILAQEGSIEFKEKEFGTQAIAVAQQVLALDSHNAEAWRIIGYAHEIMQEYPLAHDAYAKSLAIDPHNALTMSQDAHSYDLEGNTTKAEAGYRAALVLMPALDQAQMGLGRIAFPKGTTSRLVSLF